MRYGRLTVLGLLFAASAAQAQQQKFAVPRSRLELRPFTGVFVPQGEQRKDFSSSRASGFQLAYQFTPFAHVLASTSWTEGQAKNLAVREFPRARVWQYDVGAEFNSSATLSPSLLLRPFIGLGVGARNYYYPDKGVSKMLYPAAYYAVGSELMRGGVGIRLEGRSYLSVYRAPLEEQLFSRTDFMVTAGLTYHVF